MKTLSNFLAQDWVSKSGLERAAGLPKMALVRLAPGEEPPTKHWPAILRVICTQIGQLNLYDKVVSYWNGDFVISTLSEPPITIKIPETMPAMLAGVIQDMPAPHIVPASDNLPE